MEVTRCSGARRSRRAARSLGDGAQGPSGGNSAIAAGADADSTTNICLSRQCGAPVFLVTRRKWPGLQRTASRSPPPTAPPAQPALKVQKGCERNLWRQMAGARGDGWQHAVMVQSEHSRMWWQSCRFRSLTPRLARDACANQDGLLLCPAGPGRDRRCDLVSG